MPLNIKLKSAVEMEPGFDELARKDPRVKEVLDSRRSAWKAWRATPACTPPASSSRPQPLRELVPLYKTNKDEIVTQYDMDGLEKLGAAQDGLPGLTTLTIIDDALKLIEKHRGVELVVEDLPLDDQQDLRDLHQGLHQRRLPV